MTIKEPKTGALLTSARRERVERFMAGLPEATADKPVQFERDDLVALAEAFESDASAEAV